MELAEVVVVEIVTFVAELTALIVPCGTEYVQVCGKPFEQLSVPKMMSPTFPAGSAALTNPPSEQVIEELELEYVHTEDHRP